MLAVNHGNIVVAAQVKVLVFEILCNKVNGMSWEEALLAAIPHRKLVGDKTTTANTVASSSTVHDEIV